MVYFPQHVFQLILSYNRRAPTAHAIWKRVQQSTMGRVCHDKGNKEDWCKEKVKYILFRKIKPVFPGLAWDEDVSMECAKRVALRLYGTDCPRIAKHSWIERYYDTTEWKLRGMRDRHGNYIINGTPFNNQLYGPIGTRWARGNYIGFIKNMRKHLKENRIKRHSVAKYDELIKLCMSF